MVKTRHLSNKPRATKKRSQKKRSQKKRSQKKRSQRKRVRTGKKRGGGYYPEWDDPHPRSPVQPPPFSQQVVENLVVPGVLLVVVVIAAATTYSVVSNLFSSFSGGNTKNPKGDKKNVEKAMRFIMNLKQEKPEYLTEIIERIDEILKDILKKLGPQQVKQLYSEVKANMKEADIVELEKYLSEDQKNKLYEKVEQLKSDETL